MRNIATEETDSMRKALTENFESVKAALLSELRFERRRNDALEIENRDVRRVEYFKFFIVQIAATFVALMTLYVVVNL